MKRHLCPIFLEDMYYAVMPLNHGLYLATVMLDDFMEHWERQFYKEWPYNCGEGGDAGE
jgi:hypothetical protein